MPSSIETFVILSTSILNEITEFIFSTPSTMLLRKIVLGISFTLNCPSKYFSKCAKCEMIVCKR